MMKVIRDYHLTEENLEIITTAMHADKRPEVRERATAIHLLHLGHTPSQIAAMLQVNRGTIHGWHKRWHKEGLSGLANKAGRGRRPKSTPAYRALLQETLAGRPRDYGYDFAVWTVERLCDHLFAHTGIRMSERTLGTLMQRMGYVYRRPKYRLKHLQDPHAVAQAEQNLAALKRGHSNQTLPTSSSLWTKPPVR